MKIVSINKKDDNNFIVLLDNDEKLYLSLETLMKNGLRRGDEISDESAALFIRENRKYFIRISALRFIANRLHSANELKLKLIKKQYESDLVAEIIAELEEKGFIDDFRFALSYASENIRNKLWGKNKVKAGLFQKAVSANIIDRVIKELFSEEDEVENAAELAEKKLKPLLNRGLEPEKIKRKIISFLQSRGYSFTVIKQAINRLNLGGNQDEINEIYE
jgi:regulatory protein